MTWSTFSAALPQYWHVQWSRAKTARLVSAACARNGIRTKYRSFTTEGAGITRYSEWNTMPLDATTSALSFNTSTTALVAGTTARGRSVTLSTNARAIAGATEYSNRPFRIPWSPRNRRRCDPIESHRCNLHGAAWRPDPRDEGRLRANKGPRGAFRGMKGRVLALPLPSLNHAGHLARTP